MAKEKKNRKPVPFWLQIVLILACGVICSGFVLFIVSEHNKPTHTVTFAYNDGTVIGVKQVKDGKGVMPDRFDTDDAFRGWSGAVNLVTSDVEVHPLLYHITDVDENLFYFDSVYVKEGKEFTIDLRLSGKVAISSAELSLEYDPDVMTFQSADCGGLCTAEESESGVIKVTFHADAPVKEQTDLARFTFKAKKKDVYSSQIDVICKDAMIVSGGRENSVTASTLNNKIYFLQEVG